MENLIQILRDHGIAVTPQRLAVLNNLQSRRDHPTAEQIYQEVRRHLPAISFNTVYKTLEVLCQKGMVIKINPLHEVAHYDGDTGLHAHLVCRRCHHIIDLDWQAAEIPFVSPEALQGFAIEYPSLTLWGLCSQCQSRKSRKEEPHGH